VKSSTATEDRHRQHEAERPPNDQLDVHQPVLDHRVGQGQRDERERHIPRQLHGQPWLAAERERHGVESQEGHDAASRAPHQPLDLAAGGQAPGPTVRIDQDREGHREEAREVEGLDAVDGLDDTPERPRLLARGEERLAHRRRPRQHQRRHVQRRHQPQALSAKATLGEGQAEVHEHHRQEEQREVVGPEQDPVGQRELPGVGRRIDEEEEDADAVEVQRPPVGRPPQHHHRAHDQAEEADEGQVVEGGDVALGQWPHRHVERPPLVGTQEPVVDLAPGVTRAERRLQVGPAQDLLLINGDQDVPDPHAGSGRRPSGGDPGRHEPLGGGLPEDTVVHQAPGGLQDDVVDAQGRQGETDDDHERVLDSPLVHHMGWGVEARSEPSDLSSKRRAEGFRAVRLSNLVL
jgi:hypothetical protein